MFHMSPFTAVIEPNQLIITKMFDYLIIKIVADFFQLRA